MCKNTFADDLIELDGNNDVVTVNCKFVIHAIRETLHQLSCIDRQTVFQLLIIAAIYYITLE